MKLLQMVYTFRPVVSYFSVSLEDLLLALLLNTVHLNQICGIYQSNLKFLWVRYNALPHNSKLISDLFPNFPPKVVRNIMEQLYYPLIILIIGISVIIRNYFSFAEILMNNLEKTNHNSHSQSFI